MINLKKKCLVNIIKLLIKEIQMKMVLYQKNDSSEKVRKVGGASQPDYFACDMPSA